MINPKIIGRSIDNENNYYSWSHFDTIVLDETFWMKDIEDIVEEIWKNKNSVKKVQKIQ